MLAPLSSCLLSSRSTSWSMAALRDPLIRIRSPAASAPQPIRRLPHVAEGGMRSALSEILRPDPRARAHRQHDPPRPREVLSHLPVQLSLSGPSSAMWPSTASARPWPGNLAMAEQAASMLEGLAL